MYQEFTNSEARVSYNCPVEADTISKNGRNPKSQMSRGKFLIICALVLAFCGVGNNAMGQIWNISDQTGACGNSNVTATLNQTTGVLIITGTGCMADFWCSGGGEAPWWDNPAHRNAIKTVEIKGGDGTNDVKNIGMRAFKDCINLGSITIPNSVIKINGQAFYGCSSLHTVTIQDGSSPLEFAGYQASNPCTGTNINTYDWFEGCTLLSTLYLGREINNWGTTNSNQPIYHLKNTLTTLTIGCKVSKIGNSAFNSCKYLNKIDINECDDELYFAGTNPNNCFYGCIALKTVYLGRNIKLSDNPTSNFPPFRGNITNSSSTLTIGSTVTDIPKYSFYGCNGLTEIKIDTENNIKSIGNNAFDNCTSLKNAPIGTKVVTIGDNAFYTCGLLEISIPPSVEKIGNSAFNTCQSLSEVTIENCVDCNNKRELYFAGTNPNNCFSGCKALTTVYLGRNIKLSDNPTSNFPPFRGNITNSSSTLTIGSTVTDIPKYSFYGCNGLIEIKIATENNITSIGNNAFDNCTLLKNAPIGTEVKTIGDNAFYKCGLLEISIPPSVEKIGNSAFNTCQDLTDVYIADCVDENKRELSFAGNSPNSCFYGCKALTTVYLGRNIKLSDNLTSNYPPFRGNITQPSSTLTIGSTVTEIINYAFYGCCGLEKIICYPEEPPRIYPNTFGGCGKSIPNCTVYIADCNAYKTANYWKEFTDLRDFDNNPCTVGIAEVAQASGLTIYPNPTSGELIIENGEFIINDAEYRIFNITGQMVMQGKLQGEIPTINVTSLPSGMYFLKIADKAVKLVKQ